MKTYHIITYGCQMNESDSERIAAKLEKEGYQAVANFQKANLVVINVCSVRQSAINRVISRVEKINNFNKKKKIKIILTGCLLEKDKEQLKNKVDQIWPIIGFGCQPKYQLKKHAFVPIMSGCNNFCSYCVVPYTRGREKSRSGRIIVSQIKDLIKKGYQEITLLGQNVNSYRDKKTNFPKLLQMICQIPGNYTVKFLTSHPKDMSDDLINTIAKEDKIAKEVHLPIQSADNAILKEMNRHYTVGHYKKLIRKIRQKIPQVKLSTDIIVGFPGETEKQFRKTADLVKEIKFDKAYIASYSPRRGTTAAKLKDTVSSLEKKKRKRILLDMIK